MVLTRECCFRSVHLISIEVTQDQSISRYFYVPLCDQGGRICVVPPMIFEPSTSYMVCKHIFIRALGTWFRFCTICILDMPRHVIRANADSVVFQRYAFICLYCWICSPDTSQYCDSRIIDLSWCCINSVAPRWISRIKLCDYLGALVRLQKVTKVHE